MFCVRVCWNSFRCFQGQSDTEETRSGRRLLGSYLKGLCAICSSSHRWHIQQDTSVPFPFGCGAQSDGQPWQMPTARQPPTHPPFIGFGNLVCSNVQSRGVAMATESRERNVGEQSPVLCQVVRVLNGGSFLSSEGGICMEISLSFSLGASQKIHLLCCSHGGEGGNFLAC